MRNGRFYVTAVAVLLFVFAQFAEAAGRETVLDRKSFVEKDVILLACPPKTVPLGVREIIGY
jgi:hypothetical protein